MREDRKLSKLKLLCCASDDLMNIAHVFARQDCMSLSQLVVERVFRGDSYQGPVSSCNSLSI